MRQLQRNYKSLALAASACALPLLFLAGCGGGGGGGNSDGNSTPQPTSTPRATSTPAAGARRLIVQLRDASNAPVEGIVRVGSSAQATQGGDATFFDVAAGTAQVSAEVNGATTSGTINVASSGPTTLALTIPTRITPSPTATLPAPPF